MRTAITLIILFALSLTTAAFGEFVVYSEKVSKEVVFLGDGENIVLSDEDAESLKKTVMPGEIDDYYFLEALEDYKLMNKKFVINNKKISDRENAKIDSEKKSGKKANDFLSAKAKLVALGLTADEVDSLK